MFQTHLKLLIRFKKDYWEEVGNVGDHGLKLGVIKPGQFAYLS